MFESVHIKLREDDAGGRLTGAHACTICGMRFHDRSEADECCLPGVIEHAEKLAAEGREVNPGYDRKVIGGRP